MPPKSKKTATTESKIQVKPLAKTVSKASDTNSKSLVMNPKIETAERRFREKKKEHFGTQKSGKN